MAYGNLLIDTIQSSTAGVPPQFNDGSGTQVGTLCRAWVNFNGVTTVSVRGSFNVSSVTRNGAGDYTVNFTNAMPDANYAFVGNSINQSAATNSIVYGYSSATQLNSSLRINTLQAGSIVQDMAVVSVSIFR